MPRTPSSSLRSSGTTIALSPKCGLSTWSSFVDISSTAKASYPCHPRACWSPELILRSRRKEKLGRDIRSAKRGGADRGYLIRHPAPTRAARTALAFDSPRVTFQALWHSLASALIAARLEVPTISRQRPSGGSSRRKVMFGPVLLAGSIGVSLTKRGQTSKSDQCVFG